MKLATLYQTRPYKMCRAQMLVAAVWKSEFVTSASVHESEELIFAPQDMRFSCQVDFNSVILIGFQTIFDGCSLPRHHQRKQRHSTSQKHKHHTREVSALVCLRQGVNAWARRSAHGKFIEQFLAETTLWTFTFTARHTVLANASLHYRGWSQVRRIFIIWRVSDGSMRRPKGRRSVVFLLRCLLACLVFVAEHRRRRNLALCNRVTQRFPARRSGRRRRAHFLLDPLTRSLCSCTSSSVDPLLISDRILKLYPQIWQQSKWEFLNGFTVNGYEIHGESSVLFSNDLYEKKPVKTVEDFVLYFDVHFESLLLETCCKLFYSNVEEESNLFTVRGWKQSKAQGWGPEDTCQPTNIVNSSAVFIHSYPLCLPIFTQQVSLDQGLQRSGTVSWVLRGESDAQHPLVQWLR